MEKFVTACNSCEFAGMEGAAVEAATLAFSVSDPFKPSGELSVAGVDEAEAILTSERGGKVILARSFFKVETQTAKKKKKKKTIRDSMGSQTHRNFKINYRVRRKEREREKGEKQKQRKRNNHNNHNNQPQTKIEQI